MPSDDRTLGQLEGRVTSMETRMERLENDMAKAISQMSGKLDGMVAQMATLTASVAAVHASKQTWRFLATSLVMGSGWAVFLWEVLRAAHS